MELTKELLMHLMAACLGPVCGFEGLVFGVYPNSPNTSGNLKM